MPRSSLRGVSRQFLPYKKGVPSRSTIARVLALFDPKSLEDLFIKWMQKIVASGGLDKPENIQDVVAIDGNVLRRTRRKTSFGKCF